MAAKFNSVGHVVPVSIPFHPHEKKTKATSLDVRNNKANGRLNGPSFREDFVITFTHSFLREPY